MDDGCNNEQSENSNLFSLNGNFHIDDEFLGFFLANIDNEEHKKNEKIDKREKTDKYILGYGQDSNYYNKGEENKMDFTINVNFSIVPDNRLVLKNGFLVEHESSGYTSKPVNVELFTDGVVLFNISDNPNMSTRQGRPLNNLSVTMLEMKDSILDGMIINDKVYLIVPKTEMEKFKSYDLSDLSSMPEYGLKANAIYENQDLNQADFDTSKYEKALTPNLQDRFLDLFGLSKVIDKRAYSRLVLFGVFHYDQMFNKGNIIYSNLELFQNGFRRLEQDGGEMMLMSPDHLHYARVLEFIQLSSGDFTVLILKQRRQTDAPNSFFSKDFYLIPNGEMKKFQGIDVEKDLYKLLEGEDLPESQNYFEGKSLLFSDSDSIFGYQPISDSVRKEFLRLIQINN